VAGEIAKMSSIEKTPGEDIAVDAALPIYGALFESVALWAVIAGVVMFLVSPFIRRLMHGVR